jgi:hypothetical protein
MWRLRNEYPSNSKMTQTFGGFDCNAAEGIGLASEIDKGSAVSDVFLFSTKSYWEASSIRGIIRQFLMDHQVSDDAIDWILADIAPRLAAISGDVSVEVPKPALEAAGAFVSCLNKMTSRTLVELLKLEIELYRECIDRGWQSTSSCLAALTDNRSCSSIRRERTFR